MHCLLAAATAAEIEPFLAHYRDSQKTAFIDFTIDVLITGVGLTATTYQLGRYMRLRKPDLAIQAGIAGCFDTSATLGNVYVINKDAIADEGVTENGELKTVFDLKLQPASRSPYKNGWLVNPYTPMLKRSKLKRATAVSVNQVTTNKKTIEQYRHKFKPLVESMEGAAFHYCCLMEAVPFMQLRATSNYMGERNKKKWLLKDSIGNLNNELIRLFENL